MKHPSSLSQRLALRDGSEALVRAIRPDDKQRLSDSFHRLTGKSIYFRFFSIKHELTEAELECFTEVDFEHHVGLVATVFRGGQEQIVGVGRYVEAAATGSERGAEIAFAVDDAYQQLGVGTRLFEQIVHVARANGIGRLEADVLLDNMGMLEIFRHSGYSLRTTIGDGIANVTFSIGSEPPGDVSPCSSAAGHADGVEDLVATSMEREGLHGTLHLEPPVPRAGETNQFCYAEDGIVLGVVTLSSGAHVELLALVHPDHRRTGIGRALLEAARAECRRRGLSEILLVSEESSFAGPSFAQVAGGRYRFSEHLLEFDPATVSLASAPPDESMALREAVAGDAETVARLFSACFDDPEERRCSQISTWLRDPEQHVYLGWLDGQAVAVLRVASNGATADLNTFGVHPAFRGRGLGRQMLERVVRGLLGEGKTARIEVQTDNENALSLYLSCGFRTVTTYRYYVLRT